MTYGEPLNSTSELQNLSDFDLLARVIYGEARGETLTGKRAVAYVVANRRNKNSSEFGGNTYKGVILYKNGFSSMTGTAVLKPDTSSQAWADCVSTAVGLGTYDNPIGASLWFRTNSSYNAACKTENGIEKVLISGAYKTVTYKKIIGNHTFYLLENY